MEKSWSLTKKFLILFKLRRYAAAFQNPTNMYVNTESWNFVIRSRKSNGILSQRYRGNPDIENTSFHIFIFVFSQTLTFGLQPNYITPEFTQPWQLPVVGVFALFLNMHRQGPVVHQWAAYFSKVVSLPKWSLTKVWLCMQQITFIWAPHGGGGGLDVSGNGFKHGFI